MVLPAYGAELPKTSRTRGLLRELLVKLDSTDVYAARKEARIEAIKSKLPGNSDLERYDLYNSISYGYHNYIVDSSLFYLKKAREVSLAMANDSLRITADFNIVTLLSNVGFTAEAHEILASIPRKDMKDELLVQYYNSWSSFYHSVYTGSLEPEYLRHEYRDRYSIYRDSLLAVLDTTSIVYLRNVEKKEARAGNYAEARRYNALRLSQLPNPKSGAYATCLYDRFQISYYYEHKLTAEAVDDLLESAIIEVENSNHDIASLLRVESLLISSNEVKAAKKVSDYYYSSLRQYGSRNRLIDGAEQAIQINDRNSQFLQKRNHEIQIALALISLLLLALILVLLRMNESRLKILELKDNLQRSGEISKGYVGVLFQLYSSYIKRLDVFRTRIHSSLKKGHVEQVIQITGPSEDIAAEERRELFNNFDTAFVDIFPDYIETVNGCLRPEAKIIPKKTEILTTELRILALIKLGIDDSAKIAEMLHCSIKTVYNLRSVFKSRLAISEEEFDKVIAEL